jgi:hypothetical protein
LSEIKADLDNYAKKLSSHLESLKAKMGAQADLVKDIEGDRQLACILDELEAAVADLLQNLERSSTKAAGGER